MSAETLKKFLFCDECAHFVVSQTDDGRNPCAKGHKMKFQMPRDFDDRDWGFYKTGCTDRKFESGGGQHV
jgi:hypothetical protein